MTCAELHRWASGLERHTVPFTPESIPVNGIYILFEKGERAHGTRRIVRVGTHTGEGQLSSRLHQHFYMENKDRSIFRKNIGRCLLSQARDPFFATWEIDLTSKSAREAHATPPRLKKQAAVEKKVTAYMRENFSFAVISVPKKKDRLVLESKLVSTLSLCEVCQPSPEWLGRSSPKEKIRESGLWQVNELYREPLSAADRVYLRNL